MQRREKQGENRSLVSQSDIGNNGAKVPSHPLHSGNQKQLRGSQVLFVEAKFVETRRTSRLEKAAPDEVYPRGNPIRARRSFKHLTSVDLSSANLEHLSSCPTRIAGIRFTAYPTERIPPVGYSVLFSEGAPGCQSCVIRGIFFITPAATSISTRNPDVFHILRDVRTRLRSRMQECSPRDWNTCRVAGDRKFLSQ